MDLETCYDLGTKPNLLLMQCWVLNAYTSVVLLSGLITVGVA